VRRRHRSATSWNTPTKLALAATGLEAGLSVGHALQAPGKRELSAAQLMHFQTRILGPYKAAAGLIETSASLADGIAAWRARGERRAAVLTSAALVANTAAFGIWATRIQPINTRLSVWRDDTVDSDAPADWQQLRDRWHRLHAVRLGLFALAAAALVATPSPRCANKNFPRRPDRRSARAGMMSSRERGQSLVHHWSLERLRTRAC
jgi:hypothetical protein